MKKIFAILVVVALAVAVLFFVKDREQSPTTTQNEASFDPKNSSFIIENAPVNLKDGVYEAELTSTGGEQSRTIPGAKITTRYFGNELKTDLNNDGREDVVFLVTQDGGGSGTFYYAVALLNLPDGNHVGSDGYFLGDRIAPQTTEVSQNPRHKNVIVVNYADRAPGEPMSTSPSVGKSAYIKLDTERMQWGIVLPDFEGESAI